MTAENVPTFTNATIWRRVHKDYWQQHEDGRWLIQSSAFSNSSDGSGMSAHMTDAACDPRSLLPDPAEDFGMVAIPLDALEALGQTILAEPLPDDPQHVAVLGNKGSKVRKGIREAALVLFAPSALTGEDQ